MSSLFALLSQQTPNLTTRKGLIILGLQNDFVSPTGKLPVTNTGYLDRILALVPAFREFGHVIWVRSEFETTRPVNGLDTPGDTVVAGGSDGTEEEVPGSPVRRPSKKQKSSPRSSNTYSKPKIGEDDEELFLSRTASREPCCITGSRGAEYADQIQPLIHQGKDMHVVKSHYSAFGGTSLLMKLRSRLITELFICGNITNLSVYSTAMDAARYGMHITLVDDCLGYRKQDRHDLAIKQLRNNMSVETVSSRRVLDELRNPPVGQQYDEEEESEEEESEAAESEELDMSSRPSKVADPDAALEADSDDDDEEVSLPIVRPPERQFDRRLEFRWRNDSKHSLSIAGGPRVFSTQHSQLASSRPDVQSHSRQPASRTFQGPKKNDVKQTPQSTSSDRRLGNIDSRESRKSKRLPWLDLIRKSSDQESANKTCPLPKHPGLLALASTCCLLDATVAEWEALRLTQEEKDSMAEHISYSKPFLGADKAEESAGSKMTYDLLPEDMAERIFGELKAEVDWQSMYHHQGAVPRLVCCQGTFDQDGSMPVYRHPSDQTMPIQAWTPTVDKVRRAAEAKVGHRLNHALIQLYRSGNDYISEHSDKTLDIAHGSNIVNVSFGAQRTMRLRTKRTTEVGSQRTNHPVPMPHNSMITMSLRTNAEYYHGIKADKRPQVELSEAEKAYDGHRISLTFRNIATFLDSESRLIWGQGAVAKTKDEAHLVTTGDKDGSDMMLKAFGTENNTTNVPWIDIYGEGFDVLHLRP
ncbi:DNA oxidative demethylase ALKBH2 [Fulvia fulva]|uniref:DNA oxidative demethylase ALKBH2 n=1 Tax=Passalora fulva TaxID=5499 RepID=A0A9Q8PHY9_PASFU|nr:DNA oxidative demethylase ALKBH2 [Fulvia fulva]KAK4627052.1 DNA oxidative demethylase ALKBH2 [Fulvia fulva]KAK4628078.1 DNA oxidative demethylase ALKBH2 [Fulvia fulva]UJO22813.1 DNA oxidative demethylase ALKBH2 [Fulvia fulva]WPV13649.1 DNA oxidative demethylase ALKBH2 [Fulvia fulva]WPV28397.1 DNA oxidative demethylase ALKBH2 [Fulvia fulva]